MKYRILDYLCCPDCKCEFTVKTRHIKIINYGNLPVFKRCKTCHFAEINNCNKCISTEIEEGYLICIKCGREHPIINFTPQIFRDKNFRYTTKGHYEFQWKIWGEESQIFGRTEQEMLPWTLEHLVPLNISLEFFKDKLILDAGCGLGKHSGVFSKLGNEVIGVDMSNRVMQNYLQSVGTLPLLHFIQTDILSPPFKSEMFDFVFSEGVIHSTQNPRKAFTSLYNLVKKNGIIGIWVYPERGALFELSTRLIRNITVRLPKKILYYLSFLPVPLLSFIKANSGTSLKKSTWRQCAHVVFDFFGPKYQSHHTECQIREWFAEEGTSRVEFNKDCPISAAGIKSTKF